MSKNETHEHGKISTSLFTSAGGCRCSKKCICSEQRTPPHLSLMQEMYLSPCHWSGQGTHSSWLASLKQIVTGRRGKEEGGLKKAFQPKPEQNGVTKISFDRKDIMLLSTVPNSRVSPGKPSPLHLLQASVSIPAAWVWSALPCQCLDS